VLFLFWFAQYTEAAAECRGADVWQLAQVLEQRRPQQNFLQLRQRLDRVDKHTYLTKSIVTPPGSIQEEACSVIK